MKISNSRAARYVAPVADVVEVAVEAGFAATVSGNTNKPSPDSNDIQPWGVDTW